MVDLSLVKKVIIAMVTTFPDGIKADKLNKEYKISEGQFIPYAHFSYGSLLSFLHEELKDNIRIVENNMDIMLYPICNKKNEHVIKMVQKQKKSKTNMRFGNRRNYAFQSNRGNIYDQRAHYASTSSASSSSSLSKKPQQRSPTMPRLVAYNPFRNSGNNAVRRNDQKLAQERLLQSQNAYLSKSHDNRMCVKNTEESNSQTASSNPSSDRLLSIRTQLINTTKKLEAMKRQMAENRETQKQQTPIANEEIVWDSSKESVWDEELAKAEVANHVIEPPAISQAESGSCYGVSDMEYSNSEPSTEEMMQKIMSELLMSDVEEEETEIKDINDIISELHKGDMIPVRLSDVNNPLKFWLHIRFEKNRKQYNTLYKEMEEFYNNNGDSEELKVNETDQQGLQYFAVYHYGQWHRVEPLDVKMGDSLRVSFIDHGSRDVVNISQMRHLPKQFWKYPKAALCCALGNIKPIGKAFTTQSANCMIDIGDNEEKMYARILDIDTTKSKAIVELIMDSNKKCLNDELIRLGHAVAKKNRANA